MDSVTRPKSAWDSLLRAVNAHKARNEMTAPASHSLPAETAALRMGAERDIARDPKHEAAWITLIESWLAGRVPRKAVEVALRAIQVIPTSHRLQALLGLGQLSNGDFMEAEVTMDRLWSASPNDLVLLTRIGEVAAAVGRYELARDAFEKALFLRPKDPRLQFNLATALRNFGELARAESLYDSIIEHRPNDWEAYKNRTELRRQTSERNHVPQLESALNRVGADWRGAVALHYALGKEWEDLGKYEEAFAAYDDGAKLRRRHTQYDPAVDLQRLDRISRVFDAEWLQRQIEGCPNDQPIFILGLPRAGSTLLERMLATHSNVVAGGELQNFGVALVRLIQGMEPARQADVIAASLRVNSLALGDAYIASMPTRIKAKARFIDKLPTNFLYVGLIAAALPRAKIIHIYRDPRDAGFGIYKTLFRQAYPFSYDLREIGRYIVGYTKLMEHWRNLLPGRMVDIPYEVLVEEPEEVLKSVLAGCGLSFEPACLEYFKNPTASSTASAVQVRQPMYRSSMQAWRRFERHLGPLLEELSVLQVPPVRSSLV